MNTTTTKAGDNLESIRTIRKALLYARDWLRVDCAIAPGIMQPNNHGPSDALFWVQKALDQMPAPPSSVQDRE